MRIYLVISLLLISTVCLSQDNDLIVTTKLDSIWCDLDNKKGDTVSYSVGDSSLTIFKEKVHLIQKEYWKRPKYFNKDVDVESIMLNDDKELPPAFANSESAPIPQWRLKTGRKLRAAGALSLGSFAFGIAAALIVPSDPTVGIIVGAAAGVLTIGSGVSLISAGNAMAKGR